MKVQSIEGIEELIVEYARKIQALDDEIKNIREDKKEILKDAKDEGISVKALNKAIAKIRKKDVDLFEEEKYEEILREAGVIY